VYKRQEQGIPLDAMGRIIALKRYAEEREALYGPLQQPTLEDLLMMHKVRIPITLPKFDKRTGTWYVPSAKAQPPRVWGE
jgi:hypothetical protein